MRHLEKRALSLLLALLLCITLFPAAALAEEGSIRPVENEENGGLSGTPAPTAFGHAPSIGASKRKVVTERLPKYYCCTLSVIANQ